MGARGPPGQRGRPFPLGWGCGRQAAPQGAGPPLSAASPWSDRGTTIAPGLAVDTVVWLVTWEPMEWSPESV